MMLDLAVPRNAPDCRTPGLTMPPAAGVTRPALPMNTGPFQAIGAAGVDSPVPSRGAPEFQPTTSTLRRSTK